MRGWFARLGRPPKRQRLAWIVPGQIAVGGFPLPQKIPTLLNQGIRVILSLCTEEEGRLTPALQQQFRCVRVALPDSRHSQALEIQDLEAAVDLLHWTVQRRLPVYVHCWAGMERSPLVCIAYLCRHGGWDLWDALNWVKHIHPPAQPTSTQIQVLRRYLTQPPTSSPSEEESGEHHWTSL